MEIIESHGRATLLTVENPNLFLKWLLNHLSPLTREVYAQTIKEFFSFLGDRKVLINHPSEITPIHIIAYRDLLIQKGQAPKTIHRKISCLSSIFDEMVFAHEIKINPCKSVKRLKSETVKAKTYFTDEEIEKLLGLFSDEEKLYQLQNKTLLAIYAYTGQRVSSVIRIRKTDVLFMGADPVLKLKIKGGTYKLLPLPEVPGRLLIKLLDHRQNDEYVFQPTRGPRTVGKHITRFAMSSLVKTSLRRIKADISRSTHSFRRTLITSLLNKHEVPLERVREMVAFHSSANTTLLYKKDYDFRLEDHILIKTFNTPKVEE